MNRSELASIDCLIAASRTILPRNRTGTSLLTRFSECVEVADDLRDPEVKRAYTSCFEQKAYRMEDTVAPKMFISYSWSGEVHEERVLKLAEALQEAGVEIILDKWDLKDGNDTHAFMEIIANPKITRVAMICDRRYVEKANSRTGGAGVEAQIITPGIYEKHDQNRYVAVVFERDEDGKPMVPTYYGARKYIDYSDPENEAKAFDNILRWAHGKPMYVKPALGKRPAYLDDDAIKLPTSAAYRRALDAVKSHRSFAAAALDEFFVLVTEGLEQFRVSFGNTETSIDFRDSIDMFLPYRNEIIDLFEAQAIYMEEESTRDVVFRFFERLLPFHEHMGNASSFREEDFDNYRFLSHELLLDLIATYVKHERYDAIAAFKNRQFHFNSRVSRQPSTNFSAFYNHLGTCERENQVSGKRLISPHGDLLIERCKKSSVEVKDLLAADFVLFLCAYMAEDGTHWFPVTAIYTTIVMGYGHAFAMFSRSTSKSYFKRIKEIFPVDDGEDFRRKITAIASERLNFGGFGVSSPDIGSLANARNIATKP